MEHMLDALSDDSLLQIPEPQSTALPTQATNWYERFKDMDRYDWSDPGFLKRNRGEYAFLPIPLTQGFFMIVPKRAYRKLIRYSDGAKKFWRAKIDRDSNRQIIKVYACRNGREREGEPDTVYAHRELLDVIGGSGDVDHVNGWSLDNRGDTKHSVNLDYVSTSQNGSNAMRTRTVNFHLPRGVELRGKNKQGKQRYGGIRAKRLGKNRVVTIRTKRTWLSPEPAARWYMNQLKKLHKRTSWAHQSLSVNYPVFPPLKAVPKEEPLPMVIVALTTTFAGVSIQDTF